MNERTRQDAASTNSTAGQRTATIRFLIVGIVILAVVVINLVGSVDDGSTALSGAFLRDHALQLAGLTIGFVLVIVGFVKFFRR